MLRRLMMLTPMLAIAFVVGCGGGAATDSGTDATPVSADAGDDHAGHDHDGWWCKEHGVPEADCALCDPDVAAAYKKKGDWCEEHNRPESQCFICNPKRHEKFIALYEAKFGEKPPAIEQE